MCQCKPKSVCTCKILILGTFSVQCMLTNMYAYLHMYNYITDLSGCLSVQIHSLLHCPSLLLAKASLTHGALLDSANANICGDIKGEEVTVVFSQRCARFLQLEQCASIRIHPPW